MCQLLNYQNKVRLLDFIFPTLFFVKYPFFDCPYIVFVLELSRLLVPSLPNSGTMIKYLYKEPLMRSMERCDLALQCLEWHNGMNDGVTDFILSTFESIHIN